MSELTLGALVHDFFLNYLAQQKGLRQSSVRSYRDTLRLFLPFVAKEARRPISRLKIEDLTLDRVLAFLRHIEQDRCNGISTRNQRLAALRTFVEYLGRRSPEWLHLCQQVAAIPTKRSPLPETRFIARDQVQSLFERLPDLGRFALRDRVLLLFLYNTGARVQEVADLRLEHLTLERPAYVRLRGKGNKWRQCPLWQETAEQLKALLGQRRAPDPQAPVFLSASGRPLTRFGIYKRVRHLTADVQTASPGEISRVSPHVWRHTAAVHLLEAGVDVNVIRGWLGHVSLNTTNRYAEITMRMKMEAMKIVAPLSSAHAAPWNDDPSLLSWLSSL
jgi:site-specific recombinase XerD